MRLLRWAPEALDDLDRIYLFNQGRSDAWAKRVEQRLVGRARSLSVAPKQGRQDARSALRLLSLPDIQYLISYRIDEDAIWIVRVHHTRENRERP